MGGKGLKLKTVLPATVLEDLRIKGKIELKQEKKKIYFDPVDISPTGDSILDDILDIIKNSSKKLEVKKWINTLSKKRSDLQALMWEDLEKLGIIENRKSKHILVKPEAKKKLIEELREVIVDGKEPDHQQFALLSFLGNTLNLKLVARRNERIKEYCKEISKNNIVAKILRKILVGKAQKFAKISMSVSSGIQAAGTQFGSDVSTTVQDFKGVRSIGSTRQKSWSGVQAARTLRVGPKTLHSGDVAPGDLILKGAKKLKEKKSEKKKQE